MLRLLQIHSCEKTVYYLIRFSDTVCTKYSDHLQMKEHWLTVFRQREKFLYVTYILMALCLYVWFGVFVHLWEP